VKYFKIIFLLTILAGSILPFPAFADYARGMEYFRKAYSAYQLQNFKTALKLIQSAINEDPQNAQHFALQGDIYYNLQDLSKAKISWEEALSLSPQLSVVREKLSRLNLEKGIEEKMTRTSELIFEIRTESQNLNYKSDRLIRDYLKSAHEAIGDDFNYYPRHKIIVLLYSPEDFAKIRAVPEWVGGLYDGKIRIPLNGNTGTDFKPALKKIIWHEYTHSLVFDLSKGKCPVFLNEGLAEYEGGRAEIRNPKSEINPKFLPAGRQAKSQKLYPLITYFLPENLNKNKLVFDAGLFYASSRSLAEYILFIWGWDGMRKLLSLIGQDKPWPQAIEKGLNIKPRELEKRWMNWAEER